jgi:trimethyllysine dioxygenase
VKLGTLKPMAATTSTVTTTDDFLILELQGATLTLPWKWVRDHSRDPSAFDAHTSQREVDTFMIASDLRGETAAIVGEDVIVGWNDETPDSILPLALMAELAGVSAQAETTLWHKASGAQPTILDYDDLIADGDGLARWAGDIERYGFGLLRNVPGGRKATAAIAGRLGYIRRTIFGDQWTLSSENLADHADSAYGQETLEPHTDGSYSHDGPGLQLFVCQERSGTGGESVLVDGFAAVEHLRATNPADFELLSTVSVPAHYLEDGVHLKASRPTIRLDEHGRLVQLTFNNYDRAPFVLPADQMQQWYDAYGRLHDLLVDQTRWWSMRLEPGDALMFDNWRCLHGRMGFTGRRVFEGCYLNHEDLESRLRVSC